MAWGWGGRGANAPTSKTERSRREWLEEHGITPMNRSTRLWDMQVDAHRMIPHRVERVGSFDMAQHALAQQRGGEKIDPIKWEGSRDMATGRAYDWCYCIEAVQPEADGRTGCTCQCVDCKEHNHWRKRNHASRLRAEMVRYAAAKQTRRKRIHARIQDWVWAWESWQSGNTEQPSWWPWVERFVGPYDLGRRRGAGDRTPEMTDDEWPTVPLDQDEEQDD